MLARFWTDHATETEGLPLELREGLALVVRAQSTLNERFINRAEVIRALFYALFTGHHCLLLGRTGSAKSLLVNQILGALEARGSRLFSIKASIDDTKDNYFGPIDVVSYREKGVKVRHTGRSILDADFAFIDEIFDTNEQVLRDLMLLLSDGVLQEGPTTYRAALHTVFAACNYLRVNEVTEALLDRFLFKVVIPQDQDPFLQLQIDLNVCSREFDEPVPFVDQAFVERVVRIARNESEELAVGIPTRVLFLKSIILSTFVARMRKTAPTFYVSPRRQARMLELLRLSALLDGRTEVDETDLSSLRYMAGILNGEAREVETFVRTLEETLRFFDVDAKLKQTTRLVATAFDLARGGELDTAAWAEITRLCEAAGVKEKVKSASWESLYALIEHADVSLAPLDELRRGCLGLLRKKTEGLHAVM